jgi:hypothetical protein
MQTCLKTLGTLALLLLANSPAPAQDQYPSQNIKIIVPTNPGATTDILARVMGRRCRIVGKVGHHREQARRRRDAWVSMPSPNQRPTDTPCW